MTFTILNAGQNYHIHGGSDRYQFILSNLLHQHGHCVIPFAADSPKNESTPWSRYFAPEVNFASPTLIDLLRFIYSKPAESAIKNLIEDVPIDIAHLHIYYGKLTASILEPLRQARVPIIQTLHEYKIVCPVYTLISDGEICQACQGKNFWHAMRKRCNRGSLSRSMLSSMESYVSRAFGSISKIDHFITVSHFQRKKMIELGIPAEKLTTVHNFIDTSEIEPNYRPGEYLLYFGRLEDYKGIFTLVEAASTLKNVPLLIVGDGEARFELEKVIEKRNLQHIKLLGFKQKDELLPLIRNSICTIAPSEWYETFGFTLVESFAHGRPVIASRIGGMTEIVTDTVDGYLVSPGNVEELQSRMLWMATHRHKAVEMGLAGRLKVETKFCPELHYEKILSLYQKILSQK
ncbi:MAG: glycosyltransferase family 4 protein [Cyanobacteria bacterium P01_A01_bin.83]